MKKEVIGTAVLSAALVGAPASAHAQQPTDIGQQEYVIHCAVCHGDSGKGDGPLVGWLKKPAADLTKIQKENKGVFPFDRVYDVIDGREQVAAHGPRDMPVWGATFNRLTAGKIGAGMFVNPPDITSLVRGQIVALVGYVYSLQEK